MNLPMRVFNKSSSPEIAGCTSVASPVAAAGFSADNAIPMVYDYVSYFYDMVVRVLVLRQVPKRPFLRQFRQCLKIDEKEAEEGGETRKVKET